MDYNERLDNLENRISALEELVGEINANISSLQSIVTAIQTGDYITSVNPINADGKNIGYNITFAKGDPITIYHGQDGANGEDGTNGQDGKDGVNGKDGADGHTPVIGVKQDTDGIWYWTVDGGWLLDANNQKVKAVGTDGKDGADGKDGSNGQDGKDGNDGITPQLKIEDGCWYVSTDNGATWTQLGKAKGDNGKDGVDGKDGKDGDSMFQSVNVTETEVTFVMADGQVFVIKRAAALSIEFDSADLVVMGTNSSRDIHYTITSMIGDIIIEALSSADIKVKVVKTDDKNGTLNVKTGATIDEYSKVVILVSNGSQAIMRTLIFEAEAIEVEENTTKEISNEGGEITLEFFSNVPCHAVIPVEAQSWISVAPETKAITKHTIGLIVRPNTGIGRRALVVVQSEDGTIELPFIIEQKDQYAGTITCTFSSLGWDLNNLQTTIKRLEFHTRSSVITNNLIHTNNTTPAYAEIVGTTVRIHTLADSFSHSGSLGLGNYINSVESIDMGVFDFSMGGMAYAFSLLTNLKSIDLSEVITEGVTDMSRCFMGCNSLEELDLSSFNTECVTNMCQMFSGCYALNKIKLQCFNTAETTNMSGLFFNCRSLKKIDLSGFDMSSLNETSSMFYGCTSLADLKISKSRSAPLRDVSGMFRLCTKLTTLDVRSFDLSRIEDAMAMFSDCYSLTELNLGDFNLENLSSPNVEIFRYIASYSKSCKITCNREIMEKLLHEASEFDMFANSLRYINWYVPGGTEPVYSAPDYSDYYTSTDYSHNGDCKLLKRASRGNGIDIVILGDYYSDRLIANGTYEQDMEKVIDAIFTHEPFKSFQELFNVYMVTVVSPNETDAGIGALDSNTGTIRAEKILLYAPEELSADRYYETVFIVLANVNARFGRVDYHYDPCKEQRSTDYGSALSTMIISNNANIDDFNGTIIHEFGHAFGKLADEYWYDDNNELTDYGEKEFVRTQHEVGFEMNISVTNDPTEVPWSKFLAIDRYVDAGLGVFEGGYANYGKGIWRPTENSIMRFNTGVFNAPSREAIYYRIHKLAYGAEWEYSFDDFLEYDIINFESM